MSECGGRRQLHNQCWQRISSALPPAVMEEVAQKNDLWRRPIRRTAFLCQINTEKGLRYCSKVARFSVASPSDLCAVLLSALVGDQGKYGHLEFCLYQVRTSVVFPWTISRNTLLATERDFLRAAYLAKPELLLEDMRHPLILESFGLFFEDESSWQYYLSKICQNKEI
jgi:hypothetical protein